MNPWIILVLQKYERRTKLWTDVENEFIVQANVKLKTSSSYFDSFSNNNIQQFL